MGIKVSLPTDLNIRQLDRSWTGRSSFCEGYSIEKARDHHSSKTTFLPPFWLDAQVYIHGEGLCEVWGSSGRKVL